MTIQSVTYEGEIATSLTNSAGATHSLQVALSHTLQDSGGDYLFDRLWAIENYSLTVAAGNLDIDLYDLGALDIGAGAGRDNLGQSHANARIIAMAIRNQVITSGGELRIDQAGVGAAAWSGPWTDRDLQQGEWDMCYLGETGIVVTDTTDHVLRLSAQTADCSIDLMFWSAQT